MTNHPTPSAKEQVLAWVRSKNPQTLELKMGCEVETISEAGFLNYSIVLQVREDKRGKAQYFLFNDEIGARWCPKRVIHEILGSDMGLQELVIAIGRKARPFLRDDKFMRLGLEWFVVTHISCEYRYECFFDLTKNLHNQEPEFYEALLPLIPIQSC